MSRLCQGGTTYTYMQGSRPEDNTVYTFANRRRLPSHMVPRRRYSGLSLSSDASSMGIVIRMLGSSPEMFGAYCIIDSARDHF